MVHVIVDLKAQAKKTVKPAVVVVQMETAVDQVGVIANL